MLQGKKALVIGLMSERSIAYGIAEAMHAQGAQLGFSCLPRFKERVEKMVAPWSPICLQPCDLTQDTEIEQLVDKTIKEMQHIDILVHSVAYAQRDHLDGKMMDHTTRHGFAESLDVSVYSLIALAKAYAPYFRPGGSIIALSYLGAQRAIENYNVMGVAKAGLESTVRYLAKDLGPQGVRVNAVSAGPIRTASAAGIKGMSAMLQHTAERSPLPGGVTIRQIGDVCAFLSSTMASCITGETIYADNGYHIVGV